jgi:hypothetical protein
MTKDLSCGNAEGRWTRLCQPRLLSCGTNTLVWTCNLLGRSSEAARKLDNMTKCGGFTASLICNSTLYGVVWARSLWEFGNCTKLRFPCILHTSSSEENSTWRTVTNAFQWTWAEFVIQVCDIKGYHILRKERQSSTMKQVGFFFNYSDCSSRCSEQRLPRPRKWLRCWMNFWIFERYVPFVPTNVVNPLNLRY